MKITIWSDFVCPFCFIGQSHLDKALATFANADKVEIEYKSFLLMPDVVYEPGKSYAETFSEVKGLPLNQAKAMLMQVTEQAKQSDVNINYDIAKLTSTYDAHRVFQYAKTEGKGTEFFKRYYAAHFSEGEVLSDSETIVRLAEEVGLDGEAVNKILDSEEFSEQMNQDVAESGAIGVQGVPFFVFNNKYAVSGAQPVDVFKQVLDKVWSESQAD